MNKLVMTKSEAVYMQLKEDILNYNLKPGDHLVIRQIAKQYNMSEIPVREAIKKLTFDELVVNIPHVGAKVTSLSRKKIENIINLRLILDPIAASQSVDNLTDHQIDTLKSLNQELKDMMNDFDYSEFSEINSKFHFIILSNCSNDILYETIESLKQKEQRINRVFNVFPELAKNSIEEHDLIVDAIERKDKEEVKRLIVCHKQAYFDKIMSYLEKDDIV